ncbi:MAG: nickel pincer cofactor biosynthesis protein LarB [Gammaproteobacteria bacterium]|nr:nickel pincer cofactor biosynthesis protein LarB [Gammaproteobacteria bacterium]
MKYVSVEDVLEKYKAGEVDLTEAIAKIQSNYFEDLGHTVVDHNREQRTGSGEVVFGSGKTAEQISDIISAMLDHGSNVLVTRIEADKYKALTGLPTFSTYDPATAMLSCVQTKVSQPQTSIAVVSAGTSDMKVAEEAAITAEFFGNRVLRVYDVGVAGLHRLLARLDELRQARVLIVVAGMEGALPSVVGGLVDKPVIAVPTSVGYGAAFDGMAALLGMLTSCASGISVVNIDNGFGAGFLANSINRL